MAPVAAAVARVLTAPAVVAVAAAVAHVLTAPAVVAVAAVEEPEEEEAAAEAVVFSKVSVES